MPTVDLRTLIDQLNTDDLRTLRDYIDTRLSASEPTSAHMKIGLLADMHGDFDGFQHALRIFEREGVTHILCAGDVADRGPGADQIVPILRERGIICVAGNHDRTVPERQQSLKDAQNAARLRELGRVIDDSTADYLRGLPDTADVTIDGVHLHIAHGAPWSDVVGIFPDTRQAIIDRVMAATNTPIVLLGHTHQPMCLRYGDRLIINPGSVYNITARDSGTCAILTLPDAVTLYDLNSGDPIPLAITDRTPLT